jgi:EH domain-containing protein 1
LLKTELANHDFSKFAPLKPKLLEIVDQMLASDIAKLMEQIPMEDAAQPQQSALVKGGIFTGHQDTSTPFGFKRFEGVEAGRGESDWIVTKEKYKYDEVFETLKNSDGKIAGAAAKAEMVKSKLPNTVLARVRITVYSVRIFLALHAYA